ncbi:hypothetical protein KM043_013721 [Ampulex compressa]|nr:hypothetical protein KM043_013721 [Ampulex compressa]
MHGRKFASRPKDSRFAVRSDRYEGSREKTKKDDSKVVGEKYLVDDTRFLRSVRRGRFVVRSRYSHLACRWDPIVRRSGRQQRFNPPRYPTQRHKNPKYKKNQSYAKTRRYDSARNPIVITEDPRCENRQTTPSLAGSKAISQPRLDSTSGESQVHSRNSKDESTSRRTTGQRRLRSDQSTWENRPWSGVSDRSGRSPVGEPFAGWKASPSRWKDAGETEWWRHGRCGQVARKDAAGRSPVHPFSTLPCTLAAPPFFSLLPADPSFSGPNLSFSRSVSLSPLPCPPPAASQAPDTGVALTKLLVFVLRGIAARRLPYCSCKHDNWPVTLCSSCGGYFLPATAPGRVPVHTRPVEGVCTPRHRHDGAQEALKAAAVSVASTRSVLLVARQGR